MRVLNKLLNAAAIAAFACLLLGWGYQEWIASNQAPKAVHENQRSTASEYDPGLLTPFKLLASGGLKKITAYCNSYPENEKKNWPQGYIAISELLTPTLLFSLDCWCLLPAVSVWVGAQQYRDTRILQRAYISINPAGIDTSSFGQIIGHVVFENTGHLPAENFFWRINIDSAFIEEWEPPKLTAADLEGVAVLPVGAKWKMGSGPCSPAPQNRICYVFVWGRVEYKDGFGKSRFTDFCHRYPWDKHERLVMEPEDYFVRVIVNAEFARFHRAGNNATRANAIVRAMGAVIVCRRRQFGSTCHAAVLVHKTYY